jgi:HSP20 family protein
MGLQKAFGITFQNRKEIFAMSELILWKNQEISKLRDDLDRLINRCWADLGVDLFLNRVSEGISVDTFETKDALIVKAKLQDMDPKDLDISLSEDTLTIRGKRQEQVVQDGSYYNRVERRLASFSRTIPLPFKVKAQDVKATYKEGFLEIVLPRSRPKRVRLIKIEIR